jgi:hypothetical protein
MTLEMKKSKIAYFCASIGTLLVGAYFVSVCPNGEEVLKCVKLEAPKTRFCTYGMNGWSWMSRNDCFSINADEAICEKLVPALHPALNLSYALADPTGSYVGKYGRQKAYGSYLIMVNYRSKANMTMLRNQYTSKEQAEAVKKDFDMFLKNPKRKSYELRDTNLGDWGIAIFIGAAFGGFSLFFLQEALKS